MPKVSPVSPWAPKDDQSAAKPERTPPWWQNGSRSIEFTVYHKPMGAPRMTRRDKWKQRPCVLAYHAFRDAIKRDAPEMPPVESITDLSWTACFTSKPVRCGWHRAKPDRDNIDKAVLDALFTDDSGIASGTIQKMWGREDKIVIRIQCTMEDWLNG
jgi:Holliday junction resolvase RusA-like endonuclease